MYFGAKLLFSKAGGILGFKWVFLKYQVNIQWRDSILADFPKCGGSNGYYHVLRGIFLILKIYR